MFDRHEVQRDRCSVTGLHGCSVWLHRIGHGDANDGRGTSLQYARFCNVGRLQARAFDLRTVLRHDGMSRDIAPRHARFG
jgi:hypothetical protein